MSGLEGIRNFNEVTLESELKPVVEFFAAGRRKKAVAAPSGGAQASAARAG